MVIACCFGLVSWSIILIWCREPSWFWHTSPGNLDDQLTCLGKKFSGWILCTQKSKLKSACDIWRFPSFTCVTATAHKQCGWESLCQGKMFWRWRTFKWRFGHFCAQGQKELSKELEESTAFLWAGGHAFPTAKIGKPFHMSFPRGRALTPLMWILVWISNPEFGWMHPRKTQPSCWGQRLCLPFFQKRKTHHYGNWRTLTQHIYFQFRLIWVLNHPTYVFSLPWKMSILAVHNGIKLLKCIRGSKAQGDAKTSRTLINEGLIKNTNELKKNQENFDHRW